MQQENSPTQAGDNDGMEAESGARHAVAPRSEPQAGAQRPRGILKNPSHDGSHGPMNLTWDENNLQEAEENKDSRMKITEPKTPYVRYDAETDTVMDLDKIPNFALGMAESRSPIHDGESDNSRQSSYASSRSGSQSLPGSRRGSDSGEKRVDIVLDENLPGGGLSADASDEDESKMTEEERIKHAIFKHQRKSHYGAEGQALLAARQLMEAEEEEAAQSGGSEPAQPRQNGTTSEVPAMPNGHA